MSQHSKIYNYFILLLVFLPIVVDQLNGFIQTELGITVSLSQLFKSFITIILLLIIFAFSKGRTMLLLVIIVLLPLTITVNFIKDASRLKFLVDDVIFFTKLLTFPLSFLFFDWLFRKDRALFSRHYRTIYRWLCGIFFVAILISPLGFGITQYGITDEGVSFGYRGYFIAGNEVSALFIILFAFWVFDLFYFFKSTWIIIGGILIGMMVAGLIVTKTTLAAAVVVILATPFALSFYSRGKPQQGYVTRFMKVISIVVVLVIGVFIAMFRDTIDANVDRFSENYEKAESFSTFLLSGRNDRFKDSWKLFNSYSIPEKIFGTGWNYPQHAIESRYNGWGSSEVDYLDLLVATGVLGLLVLYVFWAGVWWKVAQAFLQRQNVYSVPAVLSFSIIFVNSFFSGHILYSALVGFYLGYFSAVIVIPKKELCTY